MTANLPEILRDLEVKKVVESAEKPRIDWAGPFELTYSAGDVGLDAPRVRVVGEGTDGGLSLARVAQTVGDALTNVMVARGVLDVDTTPNRDFVRSVAERVAERIAAIAGEVREVTLSEYDLSVLTEAVLIEKGAFDVAKSLVMQRAVLPHGRGEVAELRLIRRSGQIVPWNSDKIEIAVRKAFLSMQFESEPAVEIAAKVTARVESLGRAYISIETVQDLVQEELILSGHMKVAEGYIVYRAQRALLRAQEAARARAGEGTQVALLSVVEPDGTLAFWDGEDLRQRIAFARIGLDVNLGPAEIEAELLRSVRPDIPREDLNKTIILNAKSLMERDADFAKLAGRILLSFVYEEALGWDILRDGVSGLQAAHARAFKGALEHGVAIERLSPEILNYDLARLAAALDPSADLDFDYLGLQTLYDRYLITDKTGGKPRRIETPQLFWMRVAMGLFKDEPGDKEQRVIELYTMYKSRRFCSSTPTLFNSGTLRSQLSSCFPAGTPVLTGEGWKPIEALTPGERVLTRGGTFERIVAKASKVSGSPLVSLRLDNFLPSETALQPTADHRLWAIRRESVACLRPTAADSGSVCLSKRGQHAACGVKPRQYRNACPQCESQELPVGHWVEAGELQSGDYLAVAFPIVEKAHQYRLLDYLDTERYAEDGEVVGKAHQDIRRVFPSALHTQTVTLPTTLDLTPELGRFLGYYLAEGWAKDAHVTLTFHRAEDEFIQDVAQLGKKLFGLSPRIYAASKGEWMTVSFHSRILATFLRALVGDHGSVKRVPQEVLEAPREVVRELIVGFFRGDGGVIHARQVGATVSNRGLAYQIFLACLKLGALPLWRKSFANALAKSDPYSVILSTIDAPELIRAIGKDLDKLVWESNPVSSWRIDSQRFFGGDGLAYYRIAEHCVHEPSQEPVWDIQVENDASFVANGIAAHNCYLYKIDDSIESIMLRGIAENAFLSKWAGGLGGSWTAVRGTGSYIKGTNGESQGVIPFLKMHNDQLVAVNQGGKRAGSGCAYLEVWHNDIFDFLELRKNTGDDRRRTHDMNTANWIPDLFMKRMEARQNWTLFRANETPDLHDLYGQAFERRYEEYEALAEAGKIYGKKIEALELWKQMLKLLFETGHPWITFKDPCNLRSPQDHVGVIHSSNLCTEITLNTSQDETAVCNLGSIILDNHLTENGQIDHKKLRETVRVAVRALDNVIDINYYPTEPARRSNLRHRPIGLGVMGLQYALYRKGIAFASQAALEFNDEIMEAVAYYAYEASSDLAAERGTYQTYAGSKWDRGLLPADTLELLERERGVPVEVPRGGKMDWEALRARIKKQGMRNSNVLAIAPTATIANIMGTSPCIEPMYKNLFVKSNLSGDFVVLNPFLVQDLKAQGLWTADIIEQIKYFDGDLQDVEGIPMAIKERYLTAFQIPYEFVIDAAARRQKWIDQSQSVNLFLGSPDMRALSHMYRRAWRSGLKTTYYLRTLGASNIEKATVALKSRRESVVVEVAVAPEPTPEPKKTFTEEEVAACSLQAMLNGETCEACQ